MKAKSLETVVQMAGVIDILRHTKDLSLTMQTVNVLPWEIEESIAVSIARLLSPQRSNSCQTYEHLLSLTGVARLPSLEALMSIELPKA